jgi:hypothetical protein
VDVQTHITNFKDSTGRLPTQVELSKELGLTPQKAVAELLKYLKPTSTVPSPKEPSELSSSTEKRRTGDWLQLGLYAIAALTFILSVYFTGLWFTSMFNLLIAGAISISMVSYMVLSPQAAMKVKGLVKVPLWGSFLIALVFSMGSTVAGQYNKLTENVDIESSAQRAELSILRSEEQGIIEAISVYRDQQEYHQRTLETLTGTAEDRIENQAYAATERNKVADLIELILEREERLNVVRGEIRNELQEGNVGVVAKRDDLFSWLAALLGLSRAQVEFLVTALPAIFIDIIAALSLNLAIRQGASRRTGTTPV